MHCDNVYLTCGVTVVNKKRRAANNGRSKDNVRSKLSSDQTNPWIAGYHVRSSFKEVSIFNCLIITRDNSHVSERKKNEYKSRQISGREIPGNYCTWDKTPCILYNFIQWRRISKPYDTS